MFTSLIFYIPSTPPLPSWFRYRSICMQDEQEYLHCNHGTLLILWSCLERLGWYEQWQADFCYCRLGRWISQMAYTPYFRTAYPHLSHVLEVLQVILPPPSKERSKNRIEDFNRWKLAQLSREMSLGKYWVRFYAYGLARKRLPVEHPDTKQYSRHFDVRV